MPPIITSDGMIPHDHIIRYRTVEGAAFVFPTFRLSSSLPPSLPSSRTDGFVGGSAAYQPGAQARSVHHISGRDRLLHAEPQHDGTGPRLEGQDGVHDTVGRAPYRYLRTFFLFEMDNGCQRKRKKATAQIDHHSPSLWYAGSLYVQQKHCFFFFTTACACNSCVFFFSPLPAIKRSSSTKLDLFRSFVRSSVRPSVRVFSSASFLFCFVFSLFFSPWCVFSSITVTTFQRAVPSGDCPGNHEPTARDRPGHSTAIAEAVCGGAAAHGGAAGEYPRAHREEVHAGGRGGLGVGGGANRRVS